MNTTVYKDNERDLEIRAKAVERLEKKFGPFFADIKAKEGLDIQSIIENETLSPIELSRLANRQEVLMEGTFYNPKSSDTLYQGYISVTLKELPPPPVGPGWKIFMYKVKSIEQDGHIKPVRSRIPNGASLILNDREYAFDSEEAVAWRLSGKGILQKTEKATFLFTPSIWDENTGTYATVNYIKMRLASRNKNELLLLPLNEKMGYTEKTKVGGFHLSESDIEALASGQLVMLENKDGKKSCVRFDCSKNNITETLPLSLAVSLREKASKRQEKKRIQPVVAFTEKTKTSLNASHRK